MPHTQLCMTDIQSPGQVYLIHSTNMRVRHTTNSLLLLVESAPKELLVRADTTRAKLCCMDLCGLEKIPVFLHSPQGMWSGFEGLASRGSDVWSVFWRMNRGELSKDSGGWMGLCSLGVGGAAWRPLFCDRAQGYPLETEPWCPPSQVSSAQVTLHWSLLVSQKPLLYARQHLLLGMPSSPLLPMGKVALNGTLNLARLSKECRLCLELVFIICFPDVSDGKESAFNVGDLGLIPGLENPLEKGMATHSSILAWRIPWTEEPDGLQSMGWQRVRQDWVIFIHSLTHKNYRPPKGAWWTSVEEAGLWGQVSGPESWIAHWQMWVPGQVPQLY